jgi:hypothetical protein
VVYQPKLITVMHYGRYKILEFIFSYFAADNLHFLSLSNHLFASRTLFATPMPSSLGILQSSTAMSYEGRSSCSECLGTFQGRSGRRPL